MPQSNTVLITGATSGVGFLLAKRLAEENVQVLATGRNKEKLEELRACGIEGFCADLREDAQLDWLVSKIGVPQTVIFSAGVGRFHLAHETADEEIDEMLAVNIAVPMKLTSRLLPLMMERKSGHLLYIGSQAGKIATPKTSVYAATKHALIGYTNALRMEAAPNNIQVSVIHPGPIDTPFIDMADAEGNYKQALGAHLLTAESVVDSIVQTMKQPKREVHIPKAASLAGKLYALAPAAVEKAAKPFFYKK